MSFHKEHAEELFIIAKFQHVPTIKKMIDSVGETETIKQIYDIVDRTLKKSGVFELASCHKGCYFCCHDPVYLSGAEGRYLQKYVKDNNIKPNRSKLKKQNKVDDPLDLKWNDRQCVFLGEDKTCKVYDARPLVCRTHNSHSDPKYCNRGKYNVGTREGRVLELEAFFVALEIIEQKGMMDPNETKTIDKFFKL